MKDPLVIDVASSNERLKRFRELLEQEDENDFEVVSSTKQRLDLLHAIPEDDIIVITKPPRVPPRQHTGNGPHIKIPSLVAVAVGCLTLMIYRLQKYKSRKHGRLLSSYDSLKKKPNDDKNKTSSLATPLLKKSSIPKGPPPGSPKHEIPLPSKLLAIGTLQNSSQDLPELLGESNETKKETRIIESCGVKAVIQSSAMTFTTLDTNMNMFDATNTVHQNARETKIQVATQIAQDIHLVQRVLIEKGLDTSMAPQLAISLQSSQHLVDSQRELETRRLMVDAHHKSLDRQLSQRQHEESLQAQKFDPNWKEKLTKQRDGCWSAVSQLVWEVGAVYVLSKLAKPLLRLYSDHNRMVSTQELLRLVFTSLCKCNSHDSLPPERGMIASLFRSSHVTLAFQLMGLDSMVDTGMCYGYCAVSFSSVVIVALVLHQGLRVFSSPNIAHHVVNAAALAGLYSQSNVDVANDINFFSLVLVMMSLFGVVQWKASTHRTALARSARFNIQTFERSWNECQDCMETLHLQLCLFRYLMVAVYCVRLVLEGQTASSLDEKQSS